MRASGSPRQAPPAVPRNVTAAAPAGFGSESPSRAALKRGSTALLAKCLRRLSKFFPKSPGEGCLVGIAGCVGDFGDCTMAPAQCCGCTLQSPLAQIRHWSNTYQGAESVGKTRSGHADLARESFHGPRMCRLLVDCRNCTPDPCIGKAIQQSLQFRRLVACKAYGFDEKNLRESRNGDQRARLIVEHLLHEQRKDFAKPGTLG